MAAQYGAEEAREHMANVRSYMFLMRLVHRGYFIWPPGATQDVIDQASETFLSGAPVRWYYHPLPNSDSEVTYE